MATSTVSPLKYDLTGPVGVSTNTTGATLYQGSLYTFTFTYQADLTGFGAHMALVTPTAEQSSALVELTSGAGITIVPNSPVPGQSQVTVTITATQLATLNVSFNPAATPLQVTGYYDLFLDPGGTPGPTSVVALYGNWTMLPEATTSFVTQQLDNQTATGGNLSPAINSLCIQSIADEQWAISSSPFSSATPVRINDQQDNPPFADSCLLNPYKNASGLDQRTFRVVAPAGATSLTFTMRAKLPTGVVASTIGLAWFDGAFVTNLQAGTAVLTAQYANYTLTLPNVTPGLEYNIFVTCNRASLGASAQAQAEIDTVSITASGATGLFSNGNFVRLHLYPHLYNGNAEEDTNLTDRGYRHSAFAQVTFETAAAQIVVELWNGVFSTYPTAASLGVYVNGRYFTSIAGQGSDTTGKLYYSTIDFSSLPDGVRRVDIISCANVDFAVPPITSGGFIRAVYLPLGIPARHIVESPRRTLVIVGDSVSQGFKTTNDTAKCVGTMLRKEFPGRVLFDGAGIRSFFYINAQGGSSAAGRAAYAQHLRTAGATDIIWWLGVNDARGGNWSGGASQYGAALGDQFDQIHSALPGAIIHVLPFLIQLGESGTHDAYRSQGPIQAYLRKAYCRVAYAAGWVGATGDYDADNLHLTNQGDDKVFQGLLGYFGLGPVVPPTGFMPKNGGYTYSSATLFEGWEPGDVSLGTISSWPGHYNSIALAQATGGLQPTMLAAQTPGGVAAANFSAANQFLQTSAQALNGPCTLVYAFNPQQAIAGAGANDGLMDGRTLQSLWLVNTTDLNSFVSSSSNFSLAKFSDPNAWAIVCVVANGASSAIYLDQMQKFGTLQTATGLTGGAAPTLTGVTMGNEGGTSTRGQRHYGGGLWAFSGALSLQEFTYLKEGHVKPLLQL